MRDIVQFMCDVIGNVACTDGVESANYVFCLGEAVTERAGYVTRKLCGKISCQ